MAEFKFAKGKNWVEIKQPLANLMKKKKIMNEITLEMK